MSVFLKPVEQASNIGRFANGVIKPPQRYPTFTLLNKKKITFAVGITDLDTTIELRVRKPIINNRAKIRQLFHFFSLFNRKGAKVFSQRTLRLEIEIFILSVLCGKKDF